MRGKISEGCEEDNDIVIHNCKKELSFFFTVINQGSFIDYLLLSYILCLVCITSQFDDVTNFFLKDMRRQ